VADWQREDKKQGEAKTHTGSYPMCRLAQKWLSDVEANSVEEGPVNMYSGTHRNFQEKARRPRDGCTYIHSFNSL
jgi:hypothetical protein